MIVLHNNTMVRGIDKTTPEHGKRVAASGATPMVSIGIPVYNGAKTISIALKAVLQQTFTDIEVIISDNGSTDQTIEILESIIGDDARVRLIRQEHNLGAVANFAAVLEAARAPFFMFAAADDRIETHFVQDALLALESAPEAVACAPGTVIHFPDGDRHEPWGCKPIIGPGWLRSAQYLMRPADNSRFYGLHRTKAIRVAYLNEQAFHAMDWAIMALSLQQGTHVQSQSVILHRDGAAPGKYAQENLRGSKSLPDKILPLGRLSIALIRRLPASHLVLAIPALIVLNIRQSAEYFLSYARGRRHVQSR